MLIDLGQRFADFEFPDVGSSLRRRAEMTKAVLQSEAIANTSTTLSTSALCPKSAGDYPSPPNTVRIRFFDDTP